MAEQTPPTQQTGSARSGSTATATRSSPNGSAAAFTGIQSALQDVEQLKYTVGQLEHELQGYTEPNVVGRDTVLLRSFFDQAVGRLMKIALDCKINWTPPQNAARSR